MPDDLRRARARDRAGRGALSRLPGHGVLRRERHALDAPDAPGQAHRCSGRAHRRRHGRRGPASTARRRRCGASIRTGSASCWCRALRAAPSTSRSARGLPHRPVRRAATSRSILRRPRRAQRPAGSVILVRAETAAADIAGMVAAAGVLTARGGATSHAAVVARGMGRPCVTACAELTSTRPPERSRSASTRCASASDLDRRHDRRGAARRGAH